MDEHQPYRVTDKDCVTGPDFCAKAAYYDHAERFANKLESLAKQNRDLLARVAELESFESARINRVRERIDAGEFVTLEELKESIELEIQDMRAYERNVRT